jgi:hypothetical protein
VADCLGCMLSLSAPPCIRRQVIGIHRHPRSLRAGPTGARVDAAPLLIGEFVPALAGV